ncbi:MAG: hypothetical protein F6K41_34920 [Symploca sp. SIO3E6]|nr:hypothetical protein [Caldora sp. SIO3E6]
MVIGDREFRSVELAYWLKTKKVYFAFRQKQDTNIRRKGKNYQLLSELGLTPGTKFFYVGIDYTKKKGFGKFSLAGHWKRKYRGKLNKPVNKSPSLGKSMGSKANSIKASACLSPPEAR